MYKLLAHAGESLKTELNGEGFCKELIFFSLNSGLIVAIIDHEHFRLKLLYKEKKTLAAEARDLREKESKFEVTPRIFTIDSQYLDIVILLTVDLSVED